MIQQSFKHCDGSHTDEQPEGKSSRNLVAGGCMEFSESPYSHSTQFAHVADHVQI